MRHVFKVYQRYRWARTDDTYVHVYVIANSEDEVYECISENKFGGDWAEDSGLTRETIIAEKGDDSHPDWGAPLYTYTWEDLGEMPEQNIDFLRTVATVLEYQPKITQPE